MKWILLVFLLISCTDNSEEEMKLFISSLQSENTTPPQAETVKVFMLMGQSNAEGYAKNVKLSAAELAERENTWIWQRTGAGTGYFAKLNIGAKNNYGRNSDYLNQGHSLENGIANLYPNETIYWIKKCVGGTSIDFHITGGSVYNDYLNNFFTPALTWLDSQDFQGKEMEFIVMWWQGEAEYSAEQQAAYSGKFDTWLSLWKGHLSGRDYKFRICEIQDRNNNSNAINPVFNNKALTEPNYEVMPTKNLETNWIYPEYSSDWQHFNDVSMKTAAGWIKESIE